MDQETSKENNEIENDAKENNQTEHQNNDKGKKSKKNQKRKKAKARRQRKENKFTDYVPKELKEENNENKITENEQSNTKNTINENSDNNTNDNTNNNKTDNNINNNVINTNDSNEEKNEEKDINKDKEEEKTELNITNTKDIKKFEEEDDPALNEILSKQALKYKYKNSNPILLSLYEKDINDYLEEDSLKGLVGLKNFGNTCFMNSAIQCLSNCEELTLYFLSKLYQKEINSTSKYGTGGKIAESYAELLEELWKGDDKYIVPYNFVKIFISHVKQFSDLSQHDSHEMLVFLLDKIHEDLNRNMEKIYIELLEKQENENDIEASNRWWKNNLRRDNSIIVDLFYGQYKSTVKCPFCDKVSITYDQFSSLALPIEDKCLSGSCYVINNKTNNIRKINISFSEDESFKEICDKINCQKIYKGILCRDNKMYLCAFKENINPYKIIEMSHNDKSQFNDRIILYEYEKNEIIDKKIFYVVPRIVTKSQDPACGETEKENILFFPKIFIYNITDTVKKFYEEIKNYYYKYYGKKDGNFSNDEIKLKIVNNLTACTKTHDPCDYCHSRECICCDFPFNENDTIETLVKSQSKVRSFVMYLEIPKNAFKNDDYNSIKLYDNYLSDEEDFIINTNLTLNDCLNSFSHWEKLDETNEWYCPKCKEHRQGFKRIELYRLPKYLILQLKRFKNQFGFFINSKNSTFVDFPVSNLNMNKYIVGPKSKEENYIYDLIAVNQHYGVSFGGHYTALCKKEDVWYEFDDETVSKEKEKNLVTANAYILIYKLRI